MSDYTKLTDFAAKDSLPTGNANKIVKGQEIDDEFVAIATAILSKADTSDLSAYAQLTGATFSGSITTAGIVGTTADYSGTVTAARGVGDTQTASITGSTTLDFSTYQNFVLTLTGNVTLDNPSTETVGQSGFIVFTQDGTGGRTVSLGTEYKTANGAGLLLSGTASAIDVVPYVVSADGSILLGEPQKNFS